VGDRAVDVVADRVEAAAHAAHPDPDVRGGLRITDRDDRLAVAAE
jgi:hypothetical protein